LPNVNLIRGDDGSNSLSGTAGADLIYGYDPNGPQSQASGILATRVATGLGQPVFAGAPPGDTSRLFIVEKTGTCSQQRRRALAVGTSVNSVDWQNPYLLASDSSKNISGSRADTTADAAPDRT
jgi:hypothetical protein